MSKTVGLELQGALRHYRAMFFSFLRTAHPNRSNSTLHFLRSSAIHPPSVKSIGCRDNRRTGRQTDRKILILSSNFVLINHCFRTNRCINYIQDLHCDISHAMLIYANNKVVLIDSVMLLFTCHNHMKEKRISSFPLKSSCHARNMLV